MNPRFSISRLSTTLFGLSSFTSALITRLSPALVTIRTVSTIQNPEMSPNDAADSPAPQKSSQQQDAVRLEKQILRRHIRTLLKEIPASSLQKQSHDVWNRVCSLAVYQTAHRVGLFLSMPTCEIQTNEMVNRAIQDGKIVYVPRVGANFECADMELIECPCEVNFYETWPKNKWNIPEPPPKRMVGVVGGDDNDGNNDTIGQSSTRSADWTVAKPGDLDLILVPGLAFDDQGGRLGQGKGYYDRFLAKMCPLTTSMTKYPSLVAVGLKCQLVETAIPTNNYDFRMDMVVLPDQTLFVKETMRTE